MVSIFLMRFTLFLLEKVERLTNQGSLGGIDALLGCPLYLPSSKVRGDQFLDVMEDLTERCAFFEKKESDDNQWDMTFLYEKADGYLQLVSEATAFKYYMIKFGTC